MARQNVAPWAIRSQFARAMSDIYKNEVPLYSKLVALVQSVNDRSLAADPALRAHLAATDQLSSLPLERHGAIRLGTSEELAILARMLAVMGMYPTGYYDLSEAGVPVHATCFRAHTESELAKSPFRLFTSLLRLELISSEELRVLASSVLSQRQIFNDRALELLKLAEVNGGLEANEVIEFIDALMETFCFNPVAKITKANYQQLWNENRLLADVVAFRGPHINHLTPRTLDIDLVQTDMEEWHLDRKEAIEGPPRRNCALLLRQSSFKALDEKVEFPNDDHQPSSLSSKSDKNSTNITFTPGHHKARFGEFEQRGAALTPKGRTLYDNCLRSARHKHLNANDADYTSQFSLFPDDWATLRRQELVWFTYRVSDKAKSALLKKETLAVAQADNLRTVDVEQLIQDGFLRADAQTYQDFLPVSAAGIFQSNLDTYETETDGPSDGDGGEEDESRTGDREGLERSLGVPIRSEMEIYEEVQRTSLEEALRELKGVLCGG